MTCSYDPRYAPEHLDPRPCPKCGETIVSGMFHLNHENPLTAQFLHHLKSRPELPIKSGLANYRVAARELVRWNTLKDRYVAALAIGAKKLKGEPK